MPAFSLVMLNSRSPEGGEGDEQAPYSGGSPFDGTSNPSDLAGSPNKPTPTALEIGIIVGVSVLAIISIIGIFVWRARKAKGAKRAQVSAEENTPETQAEDMKDERASTIDNNEAAPKASDKEPAGFIDTNWDSFEGRNGAEAHELLPREMLPRV